MPSTDWRLGLRTIYIVPSRFGVLWLASAALLVLVAIQTGSNSTLLLAFLLLGVMALAMVLTHDNLDGLTLRCATPVPGFAQEVQLYPVLVFCPTPRQQVQVRFEGQSPEGSFCCPARERRLDLRWTPTVAVDSCHRGCCWTALRRLGCSSAGPAGGLRFRS